MYEVTCFHCGNIAHITPDAERCIICGEDLKHLITPDYAAYYFYQRAAQLAEAGESTLALWEIDRGLRYQPDSQLHLLAAILSKRVGNFTQMRQHVAAIAVDDPLRGEAEWLLRSQQERPGQPGVAVTDAPAGRPDTSLWPRPELRLPVDETNDLPTVSTIHPVRKFAGIVALLLLAVFATWVGLGPGAQLLGAWLSPQTATANLPPLPDPQTKEPPTPTLTATAPAAATLAAPVQLPTLTPTATVAVAPNLAQATATAPALAAVTPPPVGDVYDLKSYLQQSTLPALADLEVSATLQGVTLTLQGIVPLFIVRQDLVNIAQRAPGVEVLNSVDLLVRTPLTYTVVEGDNLWVISYKLYGEDRRAELLAANRTTLLDPSLLRVGQELTVPPTN